MEKETTRDKCEKTLNEEIQKGIESAKDIYPDEVPLSYQYGWLKGIARGYLIELEVYKRELKKVQEENYKLKDKLEY